MHIPPVEKSNIYQAFHLDPSVLAEAFDNITFCPEPLRPKEGHQLRLETSQRNLHAHERRSDSNTRPMKNTEQSSLIQDVFGSEKDTFNPSVDNPLSFLSILLTDSVVEQSRRGPLFPPPNSPINYNPNDNRKPKKS